MALEMVCTPPWCARLLLASFFCLGWSLDEDPTWTATECTENANCKAKPASALLQVHKANVKVEWMKERYDQSCWYAGNDLASRDASCAGTLVCAQSGYDGREFGDCPGHHCCSLLVQMNNKERFDTSCWDAGTDTVSRDASCKGDLVCSRAGFDNRNFGDCATHCCSAQIGVKERFDSTCWVAGLDMQTRDASCKEGLVCAQKGHENRDFGDCPGKHCCSVMTNMLERFDTTCWESGTDTASRDAACKGDLVCARRGHDNRNFGDCGTHCCSMQIGMKQRYDKTCWDAGSSLDDVAGRDASCQEGLVCAQKGFDHRDFGDCPNAHCCSLMVRERYDRTCYEAGTDLASRDAACKGGLVCARSGYDNRNFGDCPEGHCCSQAMGALDRFAECYSSGSDVASRDAACKEGLVCARSGNDNRNFGDCPGKHCCSMRANALERYDTTCYQAGTDIVSRDAACKGDLVCARKGYDNRNFGECGTHCCSAKIGSLQQFEGCWQGGTDMISRDAACAEGLFCARKGYDSRNFGDCPENHCCSKQSVEQTFARFDSSCWSAGQDMVSRDASCMPGLVCAMKGYDDRDFGDCPAQHCCSLPVVQRIYDRFDKTCWSAGHDMASRDATCKEGLVCAMKGYDNRNFGDCPGQHCCSLQVTQNLYDRYDKSCWAAGQDWASRDASCKQGLVCAQRGYDNRDFGDCPGQHCCSRQVVQGVYDRFDKSCWVAGQDMASRDASCKPGLVCALRGYDNREFGDCPGQHCCSLQARERFDGSCWNAGSDIATRDASCRGDLVCARPGRDGRNFGDCPGRHCCSVQASPGFPPQPGPQPNPGIDGKAVYGVGTDGRIYKQSLSSMSAATQWRITGAAPIKSLAIDGNTIFGVGSDNKVYRQALSAMAPTSSWTLLAAGDVQSVALHGDTMYGVGTNKQVYKQVRSTMTPDSPWLFAGEGLVTSIAISGGIMYGAGTDGKVYKQTLSTLDQGTWTLAGNGQVTSIAIDGDTIYGTGSDKRLYKQVLSIMSASTQWQLVTGGSLQSVAITSQADPGRL